MLTIAVAGGTSPGLGRSVVTAILQKHDQLKPIVLSRKSSKTPVWLKDAGVEVRRVDYGSEESLFDALQGVHTVNKFAYLHDLVTYLNQVICVLLATDGTWASTQKSLLNAGIRAGISRFAPAEFGVGPRAAETIDILQPTVDVWAALRQAKQTNPAFEYACFHVGIFMNYLGYGASDEQAATHDMNDTWIYVWDVKNMKASLPLTKEDEIPRHTLTEIGDVGRFVSTLR